jgi:hypothetical protein
MRITALKLSNSVIPNNKFAFENCQPCETSFMCFCNLLHLHIMYLETARTHNHILKDNGVHVTEK